MSISEKRQPGKLSIEKKFENRRPIFVKRERNFYATARQSNWRPAWSETEGSLSPK